MPTVPSCVGADVAVSSRNACDDGENGGVKIDHSAAV